MLKKLLFTKNVATWDRWLRITPAIATGIAWYAGVIGGALAVGLAIVSAMLFVTSLTGTCSVYSMFGISTLRKPS